VVLGRNYYICTIMEGIKNIVFDLGGVVFARDPRKFEREFIEFFSYIMLPEMPHFWEEYDRGVSTYNRVIDDLAEYNNCDRELAEHNLRRSIVTQEEIPATKSLIADLKSAGYKLYVLSNMSLDFIEFLKTKEVYKYFDGEVVSCYEKVVKPDVEIYKILVDRYSLKADETLFIDDRKSNVEAAQNEGICGFHFNARDPESSCTELRKILLKNNNL
jgi:HAD superfamily hydrolase (TIGR01509 family)